MTNSGETKPEILDTFGVGCFHFQSLTALKAHDGFEEYKKNLMDFLNRDNLVKEIDFIGFPKDIHFGDFDSNNRSPDGSLDDLEFIYPSFNYGTIKIKLVIPFRLQKEYLGSFGDALETEELIISIVYNRHEPVAFVRTDQIIDNPSKAVIIAWKHMRKNWTDSDHIQFCMLGPSPFHADFFVLKNTEKKNYVELNRRYGYDDINIHVNSEIKKDVPLEDFIHFRLKDELCLFYGTIWKRNTLNYEFLQVETDVNRFFSSELENKRGLFTKKNNFDAYRALIRLEKIDADIQSIDREFKREREVIVQKLGESSLDVITESYIDELKEIPITQYRNIITTLKERHSTNSTNKATIISAFIGVFIGFMLQILGDIVRNDGTENISKPSGQTSEIQQKHNSSQSQQSSSSP